MTAIEPMTAAAARRPTIDLRAMAEVVRLRFTRGGRRKRVHLYRFIGAAIIAITAWGALFSISSTTSVAYRREVANVVNVLVAFTLGYAILASVGAGGELAGPANRHTLDLVTLTDLQPSWWLLANYASRVGNIVLHTMVALPALASLSFLGGIGVEQLQRGAVALVLAILVLNALGFAVSSGAKNPAAGIARCLVFAICSFLGIVVLQFSRFRGLGRELVKISPFAPLYPSHDVLVSALGSAALAALLLALAIINLRRRHSTKPQAESGETTALTRLRRNQSNNTVASRPAYGPVGTRPLEAIGARKNRRLRRLQTAVWLVVGFIGLVWIVDDAGADVLEEEGLHLTGIVLLSLLSLGFAILGAHMFWSRLEGRSLLPLLLASPISIWSYLRGSLRWAFYFALPPLAMMLVLTLLLGVHNGVPLARALSAHLAIAGLLLLTAAMTALGSVGGGYKGAAGRSLDLTAILLVGTPLTLTFLELARNLKRSSAPPLAGLLWSLLLLAAVAAPIVLIAVARRLRASRLVPALLLGASWPLLLFTSGDELLTDSKGDDMAWLMSPLLSLPVAAIEAAQDNASYLRNFDEHFVRYAAGAAPLLAGGLVLWWTWRRFDDLTGRAR